MVSAPEKTKANNGSRFGRAATKIQVKTVLIRCGGLSLPRSIFKNHYDKAKKQF
jgi:hypothetical protein